MNANIIKKHFFHKIIYFYFKTFRPYYDLDLRFILILRLVKYLLDFLEKLFKDFSE